MKSIDKVEGTFDASVKEKKAAPPRASVERLPRYYRTLTQLLDDGILRVSSTELAARLSMTASAIRSDLARFGDFGQQGYGYNVTYLHRKIAALLGIGEKRTAVLIGDGLRAGMLLSRDFFSAYGVEIVTAFADGAEPPYHPMEDLSRYLLEHKPDLAVLAVDEAEAERTARLLAGAGVRGILNCTAKEIAVPGTVTEQIVPEDALMRLLFRVREPEEGGV